MYDEKFEEPAELAAVFGFNRTKLDSSTKYISKRSTSITYYSAKHTCDH
jgi:hypothetical protein